MKKFFKGISKKPKSAESKGKSPNLTRRASIEDTIGYHLKEKDLPKLHKAAWNGDLNKVRQLAKKDPSALDKDNRTPLHLACAQGHEDCVTELLEWKAKTNIGDNQSKTPLLRAIECHHAACVQLLVDYRTELDGCDLNGDTGLHYAVRDGLLDISTILINAGVDVNIRNNQSSAPLHIAVSTKQGECISLLLEKRADVDCLDENNRTPLMLACYLGDIRLVRMFLEAGADTTLKDSRGWTADDVAVMQAHHSCSHLITEHNVRTNITRKQQMAASANSTPRSGVLSIFGSGSSPPPVAGPDDASESFHLGAPVINKDGDDSDDDPTSRTSAIDGDDSWGDDTDVSLADDKKHKVMGAQATGGQGIVDVVNKKTAAAKQDSNMSRTSSEITWSPDNSPVRTRKTTVEKVEVELHEENSAAADDTWSHEDSPPSPRKLARVSFKKDDELKEVHDIEMSQTHEDGYFPSSISPTVIQPAQEKSHDKTKDFMAELGISEHDEDTDDLSDPGGGDGQWHLAQPHALRHGILKKWKPTDDFDDATTKVPRYDEMFTGNRQLYTVSEERADSGDHYQTYISNAPLKQAKVTPPQLSLTHSHSPALCGRKSIMSSLIKAHNLQCLCDVDIS